MLTKQQVNTLYRAGVIRIVAWQGSCCIYELTPMGRVLLKRSIDASEQEDERASGTHPLTDESAAPGLGGSSQGR